MKRLVRPDEFYEVLYPEDVRKISDELKLQGYLASDQDIAWAYSEWSEARYCASWIQLDAIGATKAAKCVREILVEVKE